MTRPEQVKVLGGRYPIGVGLKAQHYDEVLDSRPALDFFEVHAENYMMEGGAHHRYLEAICSDYRLSIHGVGMSLGSASGLDAEHLKRFKKLVERYRPWLVSEHLAWSRSDGGYLNDLLPLPLTEQSLNVVCDNVSRMQDAIGRRILIENPSSYLAFQESDIPEVEFLEKLATQTGCGLLLDVNNVYVSGRNMRWDVAAYLDAVPASLIGEIHLAGHLLKEVNGQEIRIDDHGSAVADEVWHLYRQLIERIGARPTLIEWDNNIPEFPILLKEAEISREVMEANSRSKKNA